jgi:hypothetical protein
MFSDYSWLQLTETKKNETTDKDGQLYYQPHFTEEKETPK